MTDAEIIAIQQFIADGAVLAYIESEAARHYDDEGRRWYDTRPMVDEREHSPAVVEINRQTLAYARARGLVGPHPVQPHLVRITSRPA